MDTEIFIKELSNETSLQNLKLYKIEQLKKVVNRNTHF